MQPNTMNARQLLEDARATAKARIDAGGPRCGGGDSLAYGRFDW